MSKIIVEGDLRGQLTRWMAAGLIDAGQASKIADSEAARPRQAAGHGPPAPAGAAGSRPEAISPRQRLPLVVEVLGYLGAVIAIAAGAAVVEHFWHHVPPGAVLGFTGIVALAMLAVGAVLRTGGRAALGRLRGVLWLASTISATTFVAVLGDEFWHLSGTTVALLSEGAGTALAAVLWWRTRATLQHLAAFAEAAALAGTAVHAMAPGTTAWAPGLAIWGLAVLWGIAAHRGYLTPPTAGLVAAYIGLLVGAQWVMIDYTAGRVLAVGTVAALLAVGIALHRVLHIAFGAAGALIILPQVADRYLPGSALAALSACAVGLVLLGSALWLARSRKAG